MCPSFPAPQPPPSPEIRWRGRVFHNTYTSRGRTIPVRGWSVKLQYQGRRRTFSLLAHTRAGAVAEAQILHARLLREGWNFVDQLADDRPGRQFNKTDLDYWRKRLVIRKNDLPRTLGGPPPFSAYIDHAGSGFYFPLGLADPNAAAAKALTIYLTVRDHGWRAAVQSFAHEVCIAFHWSSQPLLWTYSTVLTSPPTARQPPPPIPGAGPKPQVLVAEADPSIRAALAAILASSLGWQCLFTADLKSSRSRKVVIFCLANVDQQRETGLPDTSRLAQLPNGIPAVAYSVHPDSDAAFTAPPGGISSYFYKRLPPHALLEPIQAALAGAPLSLPSLQRAAQNYFQDSLKTSAAPEPSSARMLLTPREQQVFDSLCKGNVDKEIAAKLGISPWTVRSHLKHIFEKLNVHSRIEAMLWDGAK